MWDSLNDTTNPVDVGEKAMQHVLKEIVGQQVVLRTRLYVTKLSDGGSISNHIELMTETFKELAAIGDEISEEGRVASKLS